jgi:hypothetical protein
MKKILLVIFCSAFTTIASSQILGNIVSIAPDSAMQGQTLTTIITLPAGTFMLASPPCSNLDVYLIQGNYQIISSYINIPLVDELDADFSIDASAPLGYYDVYMGSGHFDWWTGNCLNQGWWVLQNGFRLTGTTGIKNEGNSEKQPTVIHDPLTESITLSFSNSERKNFSITVIDSRGRTVFNIVTDKDRLELNRKDLEPGIYFFRIEGVENKTFFSGKFISTE